MCVQAATLYVLQCRELPISSSTLSAFLDADELLGFSKATVLFSSIGVLLWVVLLNPSMIIETFASKVDIRKVKSSLVLENNFAAGDFSSATKLCTSQQEVN